MCNHKPHDSLALLGSTKKTINAESNALGMVIIVGESSWISLCVRCWHQESLHPGVVTSGRTEAPAALV